MGSVSEIAKRILAVECAHPIRVGMDGFCAAGKTTLADALAVELRARGRSVIRACGDDFQNPPDVRYQLGERSPQGFFRHAMNFAGLRRELLAPLGPGGSLIYRTTIYDVFASRVNLSAQLQAERSQILVLDGLFLHAPELASCFELTVFVDADYETCIARAASSEARAIPRAPQDRGAIPGTLCPRVRALRHRSSAAGTRVYPDYRFAADAALA